MMYPDSDVVAFTAFEYLLLQASHVFGESIKGGEVCTTIRIVGFCSYLFKHYEIYVFCDAKRS